MRRNLLYLLIFISQVAIAQQPQVSGKFDLPWAMTSISQIDALRGPSATGTWSAISKQTSTVDLNIDTAAIVSAMPKGGLQRTVTFPGQATAWTMTALRITICASGSTFVCEQPLKLRYVLPTPYSVRAGHPAVVGLTFLAPASQGNLAIQEDALTTTGPISPPAPTGFVTADGTWTLEAPDPNCEGGIKTVIKLNGVSKGAADEIKVCTGSLYARDGTTWYQGSATSTCGGSGWVRQAGAPC